MVAFKNKTSYAGFRKNLFDSRDSLLMEIYWQNIYFYWVFEMFKSSSFCSDVLLSVFV